MMENVQFLAGVAEILGGVAVVFAISLGFVEFRRYKATEQRETAASLARSYQTPELAATLRIVVELPEPIGMQQYLDLSDAEKNLIWSLFCSIESIGILVSRGDLQIELVDEFFSIPIIEGWRKLAPYVEEFRQETDSPQAWEWYQWLHEQLVEHHKTLPRIPAHIR
jgi:hypothetical protein